MDIPKEARLVQSSFLGGMNAFGSSAEISDNEYWFLRNARVRTSNLVPILKPLELNIPGGITYQGLEAVDHYLVLFIDGEAYYKDLLVSGNFNRISGFLMDPMVENLYTVLVPVTNRKDVRTAASPSSAVNLTSYITGGAGGLIVQDGRTQPRIIAQDGTTRLLNDYNQWQSPDNREYVPIGTQMVWSGDILFIIAPDGKSIYRSVTGRPLDFVVAINNDGNKIADATGTSHSVDYNQITGLIPLSGNGEISIAVASLNSTRLMIGDTANTFYGEPRFVNPLLFSTGELNPFSYTDILGDTVIIDQSGIRSFNATRQQKVSSNSSIFSIKIASLLEGIVQDITAVGSLNNYEFFAMKSIFGYGVFVYDTELSKFVAFDQYTGVGAIRKFVTTKVNGIYKLYFLTVDNEVYEFEGSNTYETATFYGKELSSGDPRRLMVPRYARVQLEHTPQAGTVRADIVSDNRLNAGYPISVASTEDIGNYPLSLSENQISQPITWQIEKPREALTLGVLLSWDTGSPITNVTLDAQYSSYNIPGTTRS